MNATFYSAIGENCIDVKLQTAIAGFSKVGVAELIFDHTTMTELSSIEANVELSYDLKTDKETILFKDLTNGSEITPYNFFNENGDHKLFYSHLIYKKPSSEIPNIIVLLSQDKESMAETYNFDQIFNNTANSECEFYQAIYLSKCDKPSVILDTKKLSIVITTTPMLHISLVVNKAAVNLLNLQATIKDKHVSITKIEGNDKWVVNVSHSFHNL